MGVFNFKRVISENKKKINDFFGENCLVMCEPVCDSTLVAFLINFHGVSINCHNISTVHQSIRKNRKIECGPIS
jgi:hypothetical protein